MDSMMLLMRRISNLSAGDGGRQEAKNRMREPKCSEPEAPHRFFDILSDSVPVWTIFARNVRRHGQRFGIGVCLPLGDYFLLLRSE